MKTACSIFTGLLLQAVGPALGADVARGYLEPPEQFLRRTEVARRMGMIQLEMQKVKIKVFPTSGTPEEFLPKAVAMINGAVRRHNWGWPAVHIPYVRIPPDLVPGTPAYKPWLKPGTPEYRKLLEGSPLDEKPLNGKPAPWEPRQSALNISALDAVSMTARLCGLRFDIEPDAVWIRRMSEVPEWARASKQEHGTSSASPAWRTYAIPATVSQGPVREWFRAHWPHRDFSKAATQPGDMMLPGSAKEEGVKFDEKNHTLSMLGWPGDFEAFEILYAQELQKAGFKPAVWKHQ